MQKVKCVYQLVTSFISRLATRHITSIYRYTGVQVTTSIDKQRKTELLYRMKKNWGRGQVKEERKTYIVCSESWTVIG